VGRPACSKRSACAFLTESRSAWTSTPRSAVAIRGTWERIWLTSWSSWAGRRPNTTVVWCSSSTRSSSWAGPSWRHQCTQRDLPVTLAGAGLPQLPVLAGEAKSYAERLFAFPVIDSLDETAARAALEMPAAAEGASFEPEATQRVLAFTAGYPYFLQEYGKHLWNLAAEPVITVADFIATEPIVQLQLDDNFFRVCIARTTGAELAYLSAMADLEAGPHRSGDIATRLGRSGPQGLAPTRARLIDKD
jgi:hypothetical protein